MSNFPVRMALSAGNNCTFLPKVVLVRGQLLLPPHIDQYVGSDIV